MPELPSRRRLAAGALLLLAAAGCSALRRGPSTSDIDALAATSASCPPGSGRDAHPGPHAAGDERRLLDQALARAEICVMMDRSAAAWTRGDLETFMQDYADSATYVGSRGIVRGRTAITASYAPRFAPGAAHDSLAFSGVEVDLLAPEVAHVLARWTLARGDSVIASGPTSLVMRRAGGRWRIVHDHSS